MKDVSSFSLGSYVRVTFGVMGDDHAEIVGINHLDNTLDIFFPDGSELHHVSPAGVVHV